LFLFLHLAKDKSGTLPYYPSTSLRTSLGRENL